MAPTMGATQNSQSWLTAQSPTNSATRAGVSRVHRGVGHRNADEVDKGQAQADGDGAKPAGARLSVAPMMTNRKKPVITTSHQAASRL